MAQMPRGVGPVDGPIVPAFGYIDVWFPHAPHAAKRHKKTHSASRSAVVTVAQLPATPRRMSAADVLSRADDIIGTVMCLAKTL